MPDFKRCRVFFSSTMHIKALPDVAATHARSVVSHGRLYNLHRSKYNLLQSAQGRLQSAPAACGSVSGHHNTWTAIVDAGNGHHNTCKAIGRCSYTGFGEVGSMGLVRVAASRPTRR